MSENTTQLSRLANNMAESETLKMARMARELRAEGHDVISLSLGEPDFDTPKHIKKAATIALAEGYTKYTPVAGLLELQKAISEKFKRDNNLQYAPNQIVVSNGAKQSPARRYTNTTRFAPSTIQYSCTPAASYRRSLRT